MDFHIHFRDTEREVKESYFIWFELCKRNRVQDNVEEWKKSVNEGEIRISIRDIFLQNKKK